MKKAIDIFSIALFLLVFGAVNISAYTINQFGPDAYLGGLPAELAMMENNLGISGCVIEDFDDANLVIGLTITGPPYFGGNSWPNAWGNPSTGAFIAWPTTTVEAVISISQGVEMVGMGLGYLYLVSPSYTQSIMTINNDVSVYLSQTNFPNFNIQEVIRNGYLTIKTDQGDPLITI